jgi:hypothetical protein
VEHALLEAGVGHRLGERRVDVAEQEIDLIAVDQLQRLLYRGGGIAAGRILDQRLDLAAEGAALGVDLLEREPGADQFVLAERREGAGQRIIEADLHGVGGARGFDERAGDLREAGRGGPRMTERRPIESGLNGFICVLLPH